jgi:hypothetical protein
VERDDPRIQGSGPRVECELRWAWGWGVVVLGVVQAAGIREIGAATGTRGCPVVSRSESRSCFFARGIYFKTRTRTMSDPQWLASPAEAK